MVLNLIRIITKSQVYAIAGFPKSHRHPGQRTSFPVRANWIHGSDPDRRRPAHNRMMEKICWYIRTGFHNHGRDNPQIYKKKPNRNTQSCKSVCGSYAHASVSVRAFIRQVRFRSLYDAHRLRLARGILKTAFKRRIQIRWQQHVPQRHGGITTHTHMKTGRIARHKTLRPEYAPLREHIPHTTTRKYMNFSSAPTQKAVVRQQVNRRRI
ncbi:hypothetical protein [Komagataeibacter saccharivorans]|uniref:hypothetical protein n=1 Tax=Komagataeibacter saccharivorans TaxID=265959 RepID=UPI0011B49699|nr:hypothetical protein [Komagataeibacter saccharivorans]